MPAELVTVPWACLTEVMLLVVLMQRNDLQLADGGFRAVAGCYAALLLSSQWINWNRNAATFS
jgi:hypothetical protein